MLFLLHTVLTTLLSLSAVDAFCGDNGGVKLGWGSQAAADQEGFRAVFGFNASGPFDAAGHPILSVLTGGEDHPWEAFLCGQVNSPPGESYPQTNFGWVDVTTSQAAYHPDGGADIVFHSLCARRAQRDLAPAVLERHLGGPQPEADIRVIGVHHVRARLSGEPVQIAVVPKRVNGLHTVASPPERQGRRVFASGLYARRPSCVNGIRDGDDS
ncbi:hypothetical protein GGX14DRAFT_585835 [Mycena pura]|uniref:Cellobiose dehydrogenase cytochrome domain-containing protein n=1 Tax=Mycena pura TaxID=153505 RepID=A0AAD6YIQ2_9AGAR|nr:hypothetical protein GGX14DRAFT_585835 [Mycena pura]